MLSLPRKGQQVPAGAWTGLEGLLEGSAGAHAPTASVVAGAIAGPVILAAIVDEELLPPLNVLQEDRSSFETQRWPCLLAVSSAFPVCLREPAACVCSYSPVEP